MFTTNFQDSVLFFLLTLSGLSCSERSVQSPGSTSRSSVEFEPGEKVEDVKPSKDPIVDEKRTGEAEALPDPKLESVEIAVPEDIDLENEPEKEDIEPIVAPTIQLFTDKLDPELIIGVWHEDTENIVNSISSTVSDQLWKTTKLVDGVGSMFLSRVDSLSFDLTGKEEWFLNFNIRVTSFAADISTTPFVLRLDSEWPNVCDFKLAPQPQFNVWMNYKVKIKDMLDDNTEFFGNNGNCQLANIINPFGLQPDTTLNWSIEINSAFLSDK